MNIKSTHGNQNHARGRGRLSLTKWDCYLNLLQAIRETPETESTPEKPTPERAWGESNESITKAVKLLLSLCPQKSHFSYAQILAAVLLDKALKGNMNAMFEILNRTDGKVPETHKISNENPVKIIFAPINAPTIEYHPPQNKEADYIDCPEFKVVEENK